jgi:prepilin-type N-terminal cleavage/methylation domain-containing protein
MRTPLLISDRRAFTLVELLVVIAILAVLMGLILPALAGARQAGRKAACVSNLRQIGIAISGYALDSNGSIPYGPVASAFTSPMDLYPSTGAPTSLISLGTGAPVGLGLLLSQQLGTQGKVLFCPGSDQPFDGDLQLANVSVRQAQCAYYYRHGGNVRIFDPPDANAQPDHIKLDDLGKNRNGLPIRALAIDTEFLCPDGFAAFGILPSTHHQQKFADALFSDGHALACANPDGRFTVNLIGAVNPYSAFDLILQVLERADTQP